MYWSGRIDGEELDVLRIHQVVNVMELNQLLRVDLKEKKVCFVSFNSDEGVRRNSGRLGAKDGWIHVKKALSGFPIFKEDLKFYDLKETIEVINHDLESAHTRMSEIVSALKERNFLVVVLGGG
ncbi:MAG: formimidoylglutamase, partial [Cetobacterium sp.]